MYEGACLCGGVRFELTPPSRFCAHCLCQNCRRAHGAAFVTWAGFPDGQWRILAFYENATGHFVMGGAFPGEESDALVVDHLSRRGADALLEGYAAPVLDALSPVPVREVFVDSFEADVSVPGLVDDERLFHGVFIRAPKVVRVGNDVEVLAEHDGVPVLLRHGPVTVASFHPELSGDPRLHQQFIEGSITTSSTES